MSDPNSAEFDAFTIRDDQAVTDALRRQARDAYENAFNYIWDNDTKTEWYDNNGNSTSKQSWNDWSNGIMGSGTDEKNYYSDIINKYKIKSIEDPFAENDWKAWTKLMKHNKKDLQIVGDDLYVTNLERLKIGFLNSSSNAILIKLNQIGTVTETLEVIKFAKLIGFKTIISHRSGESEDTFIADMCVGTGSEQIKTGSLARSERVSKYNQLIRIEESILAKKNMAKL